MSELRSRPLPSIKEIIESIETDPFEGSGMIPIQQAKATACRQHASTINPDTAHNPEDKPGVILVPSYLHKDHCLDEHSESPDRFAGVAQVFDEALCIYKDPRWDDEDKLPIHNEVDKHGSVIALNTLVVKGITLEQIVREVHGDLYWRFLQVVGATVDNFESADERLSDEDIVAIAKRVNKTAEKGERLMDLNKITDLYAGVATPLAILSSLAHTVCGAAHIMIGSASEVFCIVRPPGHHAGYQPGGFCWINNVVCATHYLLDEGAEKVAIIDIDVHEGNGTKELLDEHKEVLVLDTFVAKDDFYPNITMKGRNKKNRHFNFPLKPSRRRPVQDEVYETMLYKYWLPMLRKFEPDVVIVSLGLDAMEGDPLNHGLACMRTFPSTLRRELAGLMSEGAIGPDGGGVLYVTEGGYDATNIKTSLKNMWMDEESVFDGPSHTSDSKMAHDAAKEAMDQLSDKWFA